MIYRGFFKITSAKADRERTVKWVILIPYQFMVFGLFLLPSIA